MKQHKTENDKRYEQLADLFIQIRMLKHEWNGSDAVINMILDPELTELQEKLSGLLKKKFPNEDWEIR